MKFPSCVNSPLLVRYSLSLCLSPLEPLKKTQSYLDRTDPEKDRTEQGAREMVGGRDLTFEARNLTRPTMQFCALRSCDLVRVTDSRGVLCCLIVRFVVGRKCSCGSFLQGSGLDRFPRYSAGNRASAAFPRHEEGARAAPRTVPTHLVPTNTAADCAGRQPSLTVSPKSRALQSFGIVSHSLSFSLLPKSIRICEQRVMTYAGFEFRLTMFVLTTGDAG